MSDYQYDQNYRNASASTAVGMLVLGIAAGAALMWFLEPGNKEKIMVGTPGEFTPQEWLERATKILQAGRDKLIEAVEEKTPDN